MATTRPAKRKSRSKSRKPAIAAAAAILIAAVGGAIAAAYVRVPSTQVAPGVHVGNVDLSGQSAEAAKKSLAPLAEKIAEHNVTLTATLPGGKTYHWNYTAKDLGLALDLDTTVQKALDTGRASAEAAARVQQIISGKTETHAIEAEAMVDQGTLETALKKIAHSINRQPTAPRVHLSDPEAIHFDIKPGRPGTHLDIEKTSAAVADYWKKAIGGLVPSAATAAKPSGADEQKTTAEQSDEKSAGGDDIALVLQELAPPVMEDDLSKINGPIAEMNTRIRGTSQRVTNVTIATQHINGTLLAPGEVFSYNKVVGPRSEEGGYEKATILVKGRHVEDVGGGICQTASTLYNAVLKGGLKVVRRQPHTTPVVYVPYGLDATVAYGAVDFQFENDTDAPLYVYARAKGRSLTFRLYGKKNPGRKVVLEKIKQVVTPNTTTTLQDKTLPAGKRVVKDKGAAGYNIQWKRTIEDEGKPVRTEIITSRYKPVSSIIAVGAGAPKPAAPGAGIPMPQQNLPVRVPGSTPGATPGAFQQPGAGG